MKISGINTIQQTEIDVVSKGSNLVLPTQARLHAIVSNSVQDDFDGTKQITTATAVGTITQSGDIAVVITSAALVGSPLTLAVPALNTDTASTWAGKVRTYLGTVTAVTNAFTISGATNKIILTAAIAAANDATLNISLDNGTTTGITTAATSAATLAGYVGTGAHYIRIQGIDANYIDVTETVSINGTTVTNTANSYLAINKMEVLSAGTGLKNAGLITATAATDATISCEIEVGKNVSQQGFIMLPAKNGIVKQFFVAAYNATAGAITTVNILQLEAGGVWKVINSLSLGSLNPIFIDNNSGFFTGLASKSAFKVSAVASAGTSYVTTNFNI